MQLIGSEVCMGCCNREWSQRDPLRTYSCLNNVQARCTEEGEGQSSRFSADLVCGGWGGFLCVCVWGCVGVCVCVCMCVLLGARPFKKLLNNVQARCTEKGEGQSSRFFSPIFFAGGGGISGCVCVCVHMYVFIDF